jgi:hypothetical protein
MGYKNNSAFESCQHIPYKKCLCTQRVSKTSNFKRSTLHCRDPPKSAIPKFENKRHGAALWKYLAADPEESPSNENHFEHLHFQKSHICDQEAQVDAPCTLWAGVCPKVNMPWLNVLSFESRDGKADFATI